MVEVSEAYIEQLRSSFHKFLSLSANDSWITSADTEEIETAFKLAIFIEKSSSQLRENGCLDDFLSTLSRNDDKEFNNDTFLKAADVLLNSMFYHKFMNEHKLDVAISMYTASIDSPRFEKVLETYILHTASYEAILDFTIANSDSIDCGELKHTLFLNDLWNRFKSQEQKLKDFVINSLSPYKVESNLDTFVGVLALQDVEEKHINVRNVILDSLLSNMYDRRVVSKPFWLSLFKKVDKSSIVRTCKNFKKFLELLCAVVIYLGSMMESEIVDGGRKWSTNANISIGPEISYEDIISILKLLHCEDSMKEFINVKLNEAYNQTNCAIWQDIQQDMSSKT